MTPPACGHEPSRSPLRWRRCRRLRFRAVRLRETPPKPSRTAVAWRGHVGASIPQPCHRRHMPGSRPG